MRSRTWVSVAFLLLLAGGCRFPREGTGAGNVVRDDHGNIAAVPDTGATEGQKRWTAEQAKEHPERFPIVGQVELVSRVRSRLPSLRPGMTEAQVKTVLGDLPLGEGVVVSMTISGGKTVQYALSPACRLELTFIPQSLSEPPPGRLTEARLVE
jgi:hypothetical protein